MQSVPQLTFFSISLEGWLTILAIVLGPIMALLIQRKLDGWKAAEERKIAIFRTLMAYRARSTRLSAPFVQALNGIETEFYGKTKVLDQWRSLIDHTYKTFKGEEETRAWASKIDELVVGLLTEMAKDLKYHFDKVTLERNVYAPQLWLDTESEQTRLRQAAIRVFEGQQPLNVRVDETTAPTPTNPSKVTPA